MSCDVRYWTNGQMSCIELIYIVEGIELDVLYDIEAF